jgi:S1-C subfamily serine protease
LGESILLDGVPDSVGDILRQADYAILEGRNTPADLAVIVGDDVFSLLASLKSQHPNMRVIVLAADTAGAIRALDQSADDALTAPWTSDELLARVRGQLRAHRAAAELRSQVRIAEEGFEVAQTAFQALAVTEKMTKDAFSLERLLKFGAYALLGAAVVLAGVLAYTAGGERKENQRAYRTIFELEKRMSASRSPQIVMPADPVAEHKQRLAERQDALQQRMKDAPAEEAAGLREQLEETKRHLAHAEDEGRSTRGIVATYTPSVCMLHVVVAFRDHFSGRHLRIDTAAMAAAEKSESKPDGKDAKAEAKFTLTGPGPELRLDFFGTGFLAGSGGRILTNHHVAEPWWENDELQAAEKDNLEPVIVDMNAYFPNDPKAYHIKTLKISSQVDLAVVQVNSLVGDPDLSTLNKRAIVQLDGSAAAAENGAPVVLMGYPTGLDAILARNSDHTLEKALDSKASTRDVMTELAKRRLIRPLVTQGHIGDVLKDKIVYDAQTTSGGSGGPLFNNRGKVIGVNFAILAGFTGSNFGIPIRFAEGLLK